MKRTRECARSASALVQGDTKPFDYMDAAINNNVAPQSAVAAAFRMEDAPTLVTRVLSKSAISVTELKCDRANFGLTAPIPRQEGYLIALQLRACADHDLYFDGRLIKPKNFAAGVTTIYDLRTDPIADLRDPFHSLMFHLPRTALADVARESAISHSVDLLYEPGVGVDDSIVRHLLSALLPAVAVPAQAHPLFLEYMALALTVHLAHIYGGISPDTSRRHGGLALWQERRAKEVMTASLKQEVPLSRLAGECGLSVRHFARAFRQSTGLPPHRWLLKYRVEHAKDLLRKRTLSLADIALGCGFADQSHFTRVFTAMVGASPGAWRRANSGPPFGS